MRAPSITAVGLALLLGSASPAGHACGYDGMAMDLALAHPSSLAVSLAISQAYRDKSLARPLPLPGGFGMRRAQIMLEKLRVALAPSIRGESFHLLLVEPGLWTRFDGTGAQLRVTLHVAAPAAGERVMITGEGVLLALQQGQLSARQALDKGLLRLDAEPRQAPRWLAAFDAP